MSQIAAPPANIRAALAQSASAAAGLNPDVGLGNRDPRPFEEPGKNSAWTGDCQLVAVSVNWEDQYTYDWGASRETSKKVPAVSVQLVLVTKLPTGQAHQWRTKKHYWMHADPATLPDAPAKGFPDKFRVFAQDEQRIIMGWFQNLLGTMPNDPLIRNPGDALSALGTLLAQTTASGSAVRVKAGYILRFRSFTYKTGEKAGQKGVQEELEDYIYQNYNLVQPETPSTVGA